MGIVGLVAVLQLPKVKACLRVVVAPYETMEVEVNRGGGGDGDVGT
jgi:hypothetical protein